MREKENKDQILSKKNSDIHPKEAAKRVMEILAVGNGHYTWTSMEKSNRWYLRIPCNDENSEAWMKDERVELIHLCEPVPFYDAKMQEQKEALVKFCGYVKEGKCSRCKRAASEKIKRNADVYRKLFDVGKATK